MSALFFGVGTGRSGTMAIANALAAETGVTCVHEGKFRHGETAGEQVLPFLTLENRLAYEQPAEAAAIFARTRGDLAVVAARFGGTHFGDIAYNYAPFLDAIAHRYPEAKLLVFVRDGCEFVRSAARADGVDPAPVGWPPRDKPLSPVERYVALGRLAPRAHDPLAPRWESMDHVARNAWLWAETNKLIFDAVERRRPDSTFVIRYETFFADTARHYAALREFLGVRALPAQRSTDMLRTPINRRADKALGPFQTWSRADRNVFRELTGAMMGRLGYTIPADAEDGAHS
jgi:hypothetical protein